MQRLKESFGFDSDSNSDFGSGSFALGVDLIPYFPTPLLLQDMKDCMQATPPEYEFTATGAVRRRRARAEPKVSLMVNGGL